MASSSSRLRSSSSFPNLLFTFLNFILFMLSASSIVPIFLLKNPPTTFGCAIFSISCLSLLSSLVGFYSQLTQCCFVTHISLILASIIGQVLGFLALFTREKSSLKMLRSPRDPKEQMVLIRLECGTLIGMFMMQLCVLVITCAVHNCWVREYQGLEAEREAVEMKRRWKIARVQEESMANATKLGDIKETEFDEKMKNKYGKWVKTDFEG
ncbi:hypothetical protein MKW98_003983 [Papaver atlanticum]|uniref:Membrane lipoprotein n=1 Tax=Papaver atlanticum TaxID=357466 RepID=A0AAD4SNJ1_9MAGN|nr:hypothetical protein MKW98_003983 [Papaver atlanticum]